MHAGLRKGLGAHMTFRIICGKLHDKYILQCIIKVMSVLLECYDAS